jgi:hypothetical protein
VAGAQVASRRKAQHGSSRTVFHEGGNLSPGDTSASTADKNTSPASAIPAAQPRLSRGTSQHASGRMRHTGDGPAAKRVRLAWSC